MSFFLHLFGFYLVNNKCASSFTPSKIHYSKSFFLRFLFPNALLMKRCLIRLLTIKGNKVVLRWRGLEANTWWSREIGFECKTLKVRQAFSLSHFLSWLVFIKKCIAKDTVNIYVKKCQWFHLIHFHAI